MASRPTVRWNEASQRWMAWVRFPDGSRRKVERAERADAEADLQELLARRSAGGVPERRGQRQPTFTQVIDAWLDAGCPSGAPSRRTRHATRKSPNTIDNARTLLNKHVRPTLGPLWVDRTRMERLESVFDAMAAAGYATSTVDRTWGYLHQALAHAQRHRRVRSNPAEEVLLPEIRPAKQRKSLTLHQVRRLLVEAIPADPTPAMWLTGLMCGLRPGELAGLRWSWVELDADEPALEVAERVSEVRKKYVGQAMPKTARSRRRISLHPLLVAALRRHRDERRRLGVYDDEGFVFGTRNGTPYSLSNLRRSFLDSGVDTRFAVLDRVQLREQRRLAEDATMRQRLGNRTPRVTAT
jgi:integrase